MPLTTACDACRRRKVKCDAQQPCIRCQNAGLVCRTTSVPRKKGRQGATAPVLQELRKSAVQTEVEAPSAPSSRETGFVKRPGLLDPAVIQSCAEYFFARMLGTVPILLPTLFQTHVDRIADSLHSYCLVCAFCAFVFTQTGYAYWHNPTSPSSSSSSAAALGRSLLEEALAARRHLDPFTAPIRHGITIAFLLYGCQIGLGNQRQAYYFLREATTLYTAGILDQPDTEVNEDPGSLFWLLLISERAHAIRRHRPITLEITPNSPALDPAQSDAFSIGFRCLADLYRPFNQSFLSHWNGTETSFSRDLLIQLEERLRQAVPADLDLPDILLADLRVSQQWLRTMIWQLATTAGFLSSTPSHPCLDFRYPLQIAQELSLATWKLSQESMATHGVGLVEKIFEITCTFADVMACLSPARLRASSGFDLGPQDYLKHLCTLIHRLPGGDTKFLPLLLAKIEQTLPSMLAPLSRHLSLPLTDSAPPEESETVSTTAITTTGLGNNWDKDFNWTEMSRIGDKTPETEGSLQFR